MTWARIVGAGFAALLFATPGQAQEQGPSFSCNTAERASEITICESRRLSRMDRRMDRLYREAREAAGSNRERRRLRRSQSEWLAERNACRNSRRCLRNRYESRIGALEQLASSGNQDDDFADNAGDENPSFSCRDVRNSSERVICGSRRLSRLDREMAAIYDEVRSDISGWRARRKLVRNQRNWIAQRDECARDRRCLRDAYRTRIADLTDVKRRLVPAYQRNTGWRATCTRPVNRGVATVCGNEALWSQYVDVYRAHIAVRSERRRRDVRLAISDDRRTWIASLGECGRNPRCLRRSMRARVANIQERGYMRRNRRPDYQRSEGWAASCDRPRNEGVDTICRSERLWSAYVDTYRAYRSTYDETRRSRKRRRLRAERADWIDSLQTCRTDKRCLRDRMRRYSASLDGGSRDVEDVETACRYRGTQFRDVICGDPRLRKLSERTSELYSAAAGTMLRRGRRLFGQDQGKWSRGHGVCGSDVRCLRKRFRTRNEQLSSPAHLNAYRRLR